MVVHTAIAYIVSNDRNKLNNRGVKQISSLNSEKPWHNKLITRVVRVHKAYSLPPSFHPLLFPQPHPYQQAAKEKGTEVTGLFIWRHSKSALYLPQPQLALSFLNMY